MKKLDLSDFFECSTDEYWANFFDPAFVATLDAENGFISREELLITDDPEKFHTRFRITPRKELPPHIQQRLQNGLKLLQGMVNSPTAHELPEPMRKMVDLGRNIFRDFLNRDPKKADSSGVPPISLTYVEEGIFSKNDQILQWRITPDLFKDVTSFSGSIKVVPEAGGCRRLIDGEISLGIPGAGEMIEGHLLDEIQKGHARAADLTRRWLQERRQLHSHQS